MHTRKHILPFLVILVTWAVGCTYTGEAGKTILQTAGLPSDKTAVLTTPESAPSLTKTASPAVNYTTPTQQTETPTQTASPSSTLTPLPTVTDPAFSVGIDLTIEYLRNLDITGSAITFEAQLANGTNYYQYLASYISAGSKIYGLLTIPFGVPPAGGFKAIVFNHGYIPPTLYQTTERYVAYVDYLARSGFVVFKIDYRGHGNSEGQPSGSYFSPGYTLDAIAALKSLQTLDIIDPQGIGMWGHSMAGNLVLRAMLIEPDIKAGVIWAGAVYSYTDFVKYGINDTSYRPPEPLDNPDATSQRSGRQSIFDTYGSPDTQRDYWQAVSLTENIGYLSAPLQIHHAENDPVVNIGYSLDLAAVLQTNSKYYELYTYEGGGHNLVSPYFDQAMQRTVEFFRNNL